MRFKSFIDLFPLDCAPQFCGDFVFGYLPMVIYQWSFTNGHGPHANNVLTTCEVGRKLESTLDCQSASLTTLASESCTESCVESFHMRNHLLVCLTCDPITYGLDVGQACTKCTAGCTFGVNYLIVIALLVLSEVSCVWCLYFIVPFSLCV